MSTSASSGVAPDPSFHATGQAGTPAPQPPRQGLSADAFRSLAGRLSRPEPKPSPSGSSTAPRPAALRRRLLKPDDDLAAALKDEPPPVSDPPPPAPLPPVRDEAEAPSWVNTDCGPPALANDRQQATIPDPETENPLAGIADSQALDEPAPFALATPAPEPEPEPEPVGLVALAATAPEPARERFAVAAPDRGFTGPDPFATPAPEPEAVAGETPEAEPAAEPLLLAAPMPHTTLAEPDPFAVPAPEPALPPLAVALPAPAPEPACDPRPAGRLRKKRKSARPADAFAPSVAHAAPAPALEPEQSAEIFRSMRARALALAAGSRAAIQTMREPDEADDLPDTAGPGPAAHEPAGDHATETLPVAGAGSSLVASDTLEETARTLLDAVTIFAGSSMPQERALAADALALLLPQLSDPTVELIARRIAGMEAPPAALLSLLLDHPNPRAAELVVERAAVVGEHDLRRLIAHGSEAAMLAIARRRQVSGLVAERLAETRLGPVLLALARNPGATLSPETFGLLCDAAASLPALQAPLATRADLPPAYAFELFWHVPPDLRRHLLTRFLVDTQTVGKIVRSIEKAGLVSRGTVDAGEVESFVELLAAGQIGFAVQALSGLLAIDPATAERIVVDRSGEALTAALKALGMTRAAAAKTIDLLVQAEHAPLRGDRNTQELYYVFDSLSMNKACVLLTYWDWATRRRKSI